MKPYYESQHGQIYHGNVLEVLCFMESCSVQMCVTSPPYWGLRDYSLEPQDWGDGWSGSIGLEPTPELYVKHMVQIFREIRRVLRDDGTLWLNLGDSYCANRGNTKKKPGYDNKAADGHAGLAIFNGRKDVGGLKEKDLVGIPWMVAFALRADGWYLRSDIIWHKPNPMPESVTDRPTKAHEYLFLLTKSQRYFYDHEAIKENSLHTHSPKTRSSRPGIDVNGGNQGAGQPIPNPEGGRNKRTVWTIPTHPFPEAHFATFPPKLIEPCILAGSKEGDSVLDPFFGSGTTGIVSYKNNRKFVGIELSQTYLDEIAIPRIERETAQQKLPGF